MREIGNSWHDPLSLCRPEQRAERTQGQKGLNADRNLRLHAAHAGRDASAETALTKALERPFECARASISFEVLTLQQVRATVHSAFLRACFLYNPTLKLLIELLRVLVAYALFVK